MKNISKIFLAVAIAFSMMFQACNPADFGDINVDPNKPSTPYTNYMFTYACNYIPWFVLGDATNGYDPWMQEWNGYFSESNTNQYGGLTTTTQYTRIPSIYLYGLRGMQTIIDLCEDAEENTKPNVLAFGTLGNQIGAAKTIQAFYFMSLTDMIGPIVMSEAFQGKSKDNWNPKYDTQEEVYNQLDELLKAAYASFDEAGSLSAAADVIFGGDIAKWKKFNASLRMLLAIKLCDVKPEVGKARFLAAYTDGGMTTNADSFNFTYDDQHWNLLYYWCSPDYSGAGKNMVPNYLIVETMKALKDPRMFNYFDIEGYKGKRKESLFPRDSYDSFYGVPFGLSTPLEVTAFSDCTSSINNKMLSMTATLPVIPASRVLFAEAEAAHRGWISADVKTLYEDAIKASFAWWGTEGADEYIASAGVAFDSSKELEQIATQRWIASYLSDGVEVWSDWRRLDMPKMPVGPLAVENNNDQFPYRLTFYEDTDWSYNKDELEKVLSDLSDGDKNTSRVWWDTADNTKSVLSEAQCKPAVVFPEDWQPVCTGTVAYDDDVWGGSPIWANHAATLYQDVNHEGNYKIAPFGDDRELAFKTKGTEFTVDQQIVGAKNLSGTDCLITASDYNVDQGTAEEGVAYYDEDDKCYYFILIFRAWNASTYAHVGLVTYGSIAFIPDAS
ncbi:MAG: SusD/RagB family nutrient-binding outer membrane lipoprotein [Bacteroidales bacterium]|nr:SusD/RagB family nutrient-binding outer membrane lipoprotein [Bacteroidales bacterium]